MDTPTGIVYTPIRKQVARILRAAIAVGEYQPGERLFEKALCQQFHVSRVTVREALRELEGEELVESVAGQRVVVAPLTRKKAADIYQVREVIEGVATRLFTLNAKDQDLKDLEQAVIAYAAAVEAGNVGVMVEAKSDFYSRLFSATGNRVLGRLGESIMVRSGQLRALSLQQDGRAQESLKEIKAILQAIKARQCDLAVELSVAHVRGAGARVEAVLNGSAEGGEDR